MESLDTRHIIDIAILGAALLLGVAGFWRGIAKEVFFSAGALLGYSLTIQWSERWGGWLADGTRLSVPEATFAVAATTLLAGLVLVGYVGLALAGLPPADVPGRIGGIVVGVTNGAFVIAVILDWARERILNDGRAEILQSTEVGRRLGENPEWVLLAATIVALILLVASWHVGRRRRPIVGVAGAPRPGESGFRLRRESPLAPEPEKIERQPGSSSAWSIPAAYAETAPLTRVPDPSTRGDRPLRGAGQAKLDSPFERSADADRCISCGARIGDDDKYCPRCGRQLT